MRVKERDTATLCSCRLHVLTDRSAFLLSQMSFFEISRVSVKPRHAHALTGLAPPFNSILSPDLTWDVQIVIKLSDISVRGPAVWLVKRAKLSFSEERYSNIILLLLLSFFTSFTFSDRQRFFLITNYSQEVTNTAAVTDSLICSLDCSSIIQFSVFYRIFVINTSVNPLMCGREKGSKHIFVFSFCFTEKRSSPNKLLIICHWHRIV